MLMQLLRNNYNIPALRKLQNIQNAFGFNSIYFQSIVIPGITGSTGASASMGWSLPAVPESYNKIKVEHLRNY